ncbi:MAG: lipo-like protein [Betaproteobacteria bacterium]|nr:MAG: lipo-like protein [Betaproteobacteria bacterium]
MFGFDFVCSKIGKSLASYLSAPLRGFKPLATTDVDALRQSLHPGDVLLVEGNTRVSTAIKYLTQSTWSHAALYVGLVPELVSDERDPKVLIEADLVEGVWAVPLSTYSGFHTRICRPVGLSETEIDQVVRFVVARLGDKYDLKNVIDLARYLLPEPPVPTRWRRSMLLLGSGEPTRAICSTVIAQAFQSIRYPILPVATDSASESEGKPKQRVITWKRRHHTLFTPRDFDISPYFSVIKPSMRDGFDFRSMKWSESVPAADNVARETGQSPDGREA